MVFIEYISDSAAHTCCEVLSDFAQDHCLAACHVLQTVVTGTFAYACRAGVPDHETLTCYAADICSTICCTVKGNVSDDDIPGSFKSGILIRLDDELAAG